MATYTRKTVEQLTKLALEKGVDESELKDLSKAEIIDLLEQLDGADGDEKADGETVDSLEDFNGDKIHVHEKLSEVASGYIRTYSEEMHGEDFLEKAKSFKSKKSNRFFVK